MIAAPRASGEVITRRVKGALRRAAAMDPAGSETKIHDMAGADRATLDRLLSS
jgi:hypothetical protein